MRRGKLNKTSYLILLASAIFTILAYVSDQVVINKQNKLGNETTVYFFHKSSQNISTKLSLLGKNFLNIFL